MSAELRTRTRDAHAEAASALELRLTDLQSYPALLADLRAFYVPVEEALGTVDGWDRLAPAIDVPSRRRAWLLDEDLRELGVEPGALSTGPSLAALPLPALGSLARALGCLYVVEGSALGGRVVARRALAALGEQLPVAFLTSGARAEVGGEWRSLLAALDAFGAAEGPEAGLAVVASARRTFTALSQWMGR